MLPLDSGEPSLRNRHQWWPWPPQCPQWPQGSHMGACNCIWTSAGLVRSVWLQTAHLSHGYELVWMFPNQMLPWDYGDQVSLCPLLPEVGLQTQISTWPWVKFCLLRWGRSHWICLHLKTQGGRSETSFSHQAALCLALVLCELCFSNFAPRKQARRAGGHKPSYQDQIALAQKGAQLQFSCCPPSSSSYQ